MNLIELLLISTNALTNCMVACQFDLPWWERAYKSTVESMQELLPSSWLSFPQKLPYGFYGQIIGPDGGHAGTWRTWQTAEKSTFSFQLHGGSRVEYRADPGPNSDNYYYQECEIIQGTFHGYGDRWCFSNVDTTQSVLCSFEIQTLDDGTGYETTETGELIIGDAGPNVVPAIEDDD